MEDFTIEELLQRLMSIALAEPAAPADAWRTLALDLSAMGESYASSTPRRILGDMLSEAASLLPAIAETATTGQRHPAIDGVNPLAGALLDVYAHPFSVEAIGVVVVLMDDPIWQAVIPEPPLACVEESADALAATEAAELSGDEPDGLALAADRALAGIEAMGPLLADAWDAESLSGHLYVLAQEAAQAHLADLDAACFALAESLAVEPCAAARAIIEEHAMMALLDAFSGESASTTELLRLLTEATSVAAHHAEPELDRASPAQQVGRDMLAVLEEELVVVNEEIVQAIQAVTACAATPEGLARCNDEQAALGEFLQRLGDACEAIGLPVLSEWVKAFVQLAVPALTPGGPDLAQVAAMQSVAQEIHGYCSAPDSEGAALSLTSILALPCWSEPWAEADVEGFAQRLCAVNISEATADATTVRPTTASLADTSVEVPSDINSELLDGLIQELPIQTAAFSQAILHVATGQGTLNDLDVAKRAAHTLKGAANTVGIPGIANLTHHLEDVLIILHKAQRMPSADIAQVLIEAGDCLEAMSETVQGIAPAPVDRVAVLQRVLDLANLFDAQGIPEGALTLVGDISAEPSAAEPELDDPEGTPTPQAQGAVPEAEASVRVSATLIDKLLRLVSESIISAAQMREQLVQSRATMSRLRGRNQNVLQLVAELEHMVDIRGLGMAGQQLAGQGNDGHFDALEFEEFNELQTLSRQLTEAATDAREIGVEGDVQLVRFSDLIEENHRWQVQSQDLVMRTRMTPVSSIEPRLQRSVRQTSRLLDKDVTLELIGGHTLMDSHVLQALVDPLMHVLRNSIDHGLETPDVREALGKPRTGLLRLSFSREGNSIVVRCRDDGNGLDHQAIRSKAEALGIVTSDQLLSHDEVARLILRHGFSTRDAASQISGRGIGMDAVLAAIYALKGTLFLHSEHGQGLTVELRLPVSLVASHALMVVSASQVYALSTGGIQDLLYLDAADVEVASDGQMKAKVSDQWLPMVDFEQLIGAPATPDEGRNGFPVLVVQLDTGDLEAIRVQAVRASRDIVVKDMGRFVPRLAGLLGATVLGDGDVVPVIDLRELATMAHGGGLRAANTANTLLSDELGVKTTTVLVVDDSLTARRNTAQFMRDAGFEVRTATDGLDAVTMMERWVPDIILTDMEMPRMNGLELASLVRSDARLVHVPIVMITSRSTEKHRRQASKSGVNSYFVKPFNEDVMLDSVMELTQKQSKATDARAPSGSSME